MGISVEQQKVPDNGRTRPPCKMVCAGSPADRLDRKTLPRAWPGKLFAEQFQDYENQNGKPEATASQPNQKSPASRCNHGSHRDGSEDHHATLGGSSSPAK
jgi:hypothetical protein